MNKKVLIEKIDIILYEDWDPIGIYTPNFLNEYSGYVPTIYKKMISGGDKKGLSDLLLKFEVSSMGLSGNRDRCDLVASKILKLKSDR